MAMKVVYADFNNFDERGTLPLTCLGSAASIRRLGLPLADGERVVLSDGELRIVATVQQRPNGTWIGHCVGDFSEADERTRTDALESSAYPYPSS
jgi:hypothetical protein